MNRTLKCVYCSASADCLCGRCYSPYCSISCQRKDWNRHRYFCGTLGVRYPEPVKFELELNDDEQINSCEEISNAINDVEKDRQPENLENPPHHQPDHQADHQPENLENPPDHQADHQPENLENPPDHQADHEPENLENAPDPALSLTFYEKLTQSSDREKSILYQFDDSLISVADYAQIASQKSWFFFNSMQYINLPEKPAVRIKVMDTSNLRNSLITVRDFDDQTAYDQLEEQLDAMSKYYSMKAKQFQGDAPGYAPKYGELCVALNEADYYWNRAVCFKADPDGENFYLQYIDYGSCDKVPKANIMPITQYYLYPTCVHTCRLMNVMDLSEFHRKLSRLQFIECKVSWNDEFKIYDISPWN